jgi:hypothetical protein
LVLNIKLAKFVDMRQLLPFIFFVLGYNIILPCTSLAQTVYFSKDTKFGFKKNEFNVIGNIEAYKYTHRTDDNIHYLDIYTDTMSGVAIVELDYLPKNAQKLQFYTHQQNIVLLYQYTKNNSQYAMLAVMNKEGRLLQEPVRLDSTKSNSGLLARNNAIYDYVIAKNNHYFSIYNRYVIGKQEYIRTKLYESTGRLLSEKDILLSGEEFIYPQQFVLSNKGCLFFTSYPFSNQHENRSDVADIYFIDFKEDKFTHHPIPLNGVWIEQMHLQIDQDTEAVDYTAFYTQDRRGSITGVLYGKVYVDDNLTTVYKQNKFTQEFLSKVSTRNKKKTFQDFDIRNVIVKKDGGILLIAENYYMTTKTSVANAGFYSSYYGMTPSRVISEYNYGDVLIINFDAHGNILWENIIRKSQYSQEDLGLFSSYAFVNTGKYLVFIYNDYTYHKNSLTLAAIDNSGNMQYKYIKVSDKQYDWVPKHGKQTSALSLLIPCFKSNTLTFAAVYL